MDSQCKKDYQDFFDAGKIDSNEAYLWHEEEGYHTLQLTKIARQDVDKAPWMRGIAPTFQYFQNASKKKASSWPNQSLIISEKLCTDGRYIDQCAKGLLFLGVPFLFH